jgi:hypothetical protein
MGKAGGEAIASIKAKYAQDAAALTAQLDKDLAGVEQKKRGALGKRASQVGALGAITGMAQNKLSQIPRIREERATQLSGIAEQRKAAIVTGGAEAGRVTSLLATTRQLEAEQLKSIKVLSSAFIASEKQKTAAELAEINKRKAAATSALKTSQVSARPTRELAAGIPNAENVLNNMLAKKKQLETVPPSRRAPALQELQKVLKSTWGKGAEEGMTGVGGFAESLAVSGLSKEERARTPLSEGKLIKLTRAIAKGDINYVLQTMQELANLLGKEETQRQKNIDSVSKEIKVQEQLISRKKQAINALEKEEYTQKIVNTYTKEAFNAKSKLTSIIASNVSNIRQETSVVKSSYGQQKDALTELLINTKQVTASRVGELDKQAFSIRKAADISIQAIIKDVKYVKEWARERKAALPSTSQIVQFARDEAIALKKNFSASLSTLKDETAKKIAAIKNIVGQLGQAFTQTSQDIAQSGSMFQRVVGPLNALNRAVGRGASEIRNLRTWWYMLSAPLRMISSIFFSLRGMLLTLGLGYLAKEASEMAANLEAVRLKLIGLASNTKTWGEANLWARGQILLLKKAAYELPFSFEAISTAFLKLQAIPAQFDMGKALRGTFAMATQSAEGMEEGVEQAARALYALAIGSPYAGRMLAELGIRIDDAKSKLKDMGLQYTTATKAQRLEVGADISWQRYEKVIESMKLSLQSAKMHVKTLLHDIVLAFIGFDITEQAFKGGLAEKIITWIHEHISKPLEEAMLKVKFTGGAVIPTEGFIGKVFMFAVKTSRALSEELDHIISKFKTLARHLAPLMPNFATIGKGLHDIFRGLVDLIIDKLEKGLIWIATHFDSIRHMANQTWGILKSIVSVIGTVIKGMFDWGGSQNKIKNTIDNIKSLFDSIAKHKGLLEFIGKLILINYLFKTIIGTGIAGVIAGLYTAGKAISPWARMSGIGSGIANSIRTNWNTTRASLTPAAYLPNVGGQLILPFKDIAPGVGVTTLKMGLLARAVLNVKTALNLAKVAAIGLVEAIAPMLIVYGVIKLISLFTDAKRVTEDYNDAQKDLRISLKESADRWVEYNKAVQFGELDPESIEGITKALDNTKESLKVAQTAYDTAKKGLKDFGYVFASEAGKGADSWGNKYQQSLKKTLTELSGEHIVLPDFWATVKWQISKPEVLKEHAKTLREQKQVIDSLNGSITELTKKQYAARESAHQLALEFNKAILAGTTTLQTLPELKAFIDNLSKLTTDVMAPWDKLLTLVTEIPEGAEAAFKEFGVTVPDILNKITNEAQNPIEQLNRLFDDNKEAIQGSQEMMDLYMATLTDYIYKLLALHKSLREAEAKRPTEQKSRAKEMRDFYLGQAKDVYEAGGTPADVAALQAKAKPYEDAFEAMNIRIKSILQEGDSGYTEVQSDFYKQQTGQLKREFADPMLEMYQKLTDEVRNVMSRTGEDIRVALEAGNFDNVDTLYIKVMNKAKEATKYIESQKTQLEAVYGVSQAKLRPEYIKLDEAEKDIIKSTTDLNKSVIEQANSFTNLANEVNSARFSLEKMLPLEIEQTRIEALMPEGLNKTLATIQNRKEMAALLISEAKNKWDIAESVVATTPQGSTERMSADAAALNAKKDYYTLVYKEDTASLADTKTINDAKLAENDRYFSATNDMYSRFFSIMLRDDPTKLITEMATGTGLVAIKNLQDIKKTCSNLMLTLTDPVQIDTAMKVWNAATDAIKEFKDLVYSAYDATRKTTDLNKQLLESYKGMAEASSEIYGKDMPYQLKVQFALKELDLNKQLIDSYDKEIAQLQLKANLTEEDKQRTIELQIARNGLVADMIKAENTLRKGFDTNVSDIVMKVVNVPVTINKELSKRGWNILTHERERQARMPIYYGGLAAGGLAQAGIQQQLGFIKSQQTGFPFGKEMIKPSYNQVVINWYGSDRDQMVEMVYNAMAKLENQVDH